MLRPSKAALRALESFGALLVKSKIGTLGAEIRAATYPCFFSFLNRISYLNGLLMRFDRLKVVSLLFLLFFSACCVSLQFIFFKILGGNYIDSTPWVRKVMASLNSFREVEDVFVWKKSTLQAFRNVDVFSRALANRGYTLFGGVKAKIGWCQVIFPWKIPKSFRERLYLPVTSGGF